MYGMCILGLAHIDTMDYNDVLVPSASSFATQGAQLKVAHKELKNDIATKFWMVGFTC